MGGMAWNGREWWCNVGGMGVKWVGMGVEWGYNGVEWGGMEEEWGGNGGGIMV